MNEMKWDLISLHKALVFTDGRTKKFMFLSVTLPEIPYKGAEFEEKFI